jgi:hypothetical protein
MLVAVAILALLVVMVSQMVGSVASGTAASGKHISADDEARTAFDRMAADIAGMITRPDVNPFWVTNVGNDGFYFYSQAPASFTNTTNSQIALIGYCVTTNGLERLGLGQGWDNLLFTNGAVSTNTVVSNNYTTIAPSVFRMEYALLMKPGSTNNGTTTTNGNGVYMKTNNPGQAMQDIAGIVVALGLLDQTSRKITPSGTVSGWSNDTTDFPDATANGISVGSWITNARSISGVPQAARAQIRVYQRYFPLNR